MWKRLPQESDPIEARTPGLAQLQNRGSQRWVPIRVSPPRPGCTTVCDGNEKSPTRIEAISLERSAAGRSAPPDPCASSVSPVNTADSAGAYQQRAPCVMPGVWIDSNPVSYTH